ncbi:MAG TPA: nitrous oxide reductase accessory protein NosL [Rubrivivax sp.]|jgi:copper chaperone NosL|nr:nitrous oxide reductase accessory protein NosL [Pseudomonadota bacterium]HOL38127.1 nitrous oxide reductase accessory protein NosL [Rubrivivax sp.]HPP82631.1 nitrous oxide reductase accessory protein NosL [Rubrivivax sp.]
MSSFAPSPLRRALLLAAVFTAAGCAKPEPSTQPRAITRETVCSLDGMTLADYPGPKGQIVYAQGEPDFFCDTVELVAILLRPEQVRAIAGAYTQDMAATDWTQPLDHWIDARRAIYVVGSDAKGSMGPTLATFARVEDAQAFAARHGGQVLHFEQITPAMVNLDGGVLKDERM